MTQAPAAHRSRHSFAGLLFVTACAAATTSAHAQKMTKGPTLPTGTTVVADSVRKVGKTWTTGWREYAADGSWRRVYHVRDEASGGTMVVFADGLPGKRSASVSRFSYSARSKSGIVVQRDEVVTTADVTPATFAQSERSSPVPTDIAQRIRGLGGELGQLQQLSDITKRMQEMGTAFAAAGAKAQSLNPAGGFAGRGPRGGPGWNDPRGGIGRDGRASDGSKGGKVVEMTSGRDADGNTQHTRTTEFPNGSTETTILTVDGDGASESTTMRDRDGNVTGGSSFSSTRDEGYRETTYTRDEKTGVITFRTTRIDQAGNKRTVEGTERRSTPSETGTRGRYEVELAQFVPWLADAYYAQWKRETDLLTSGGRISQPGGAPTLVLNEGPEVGVTGVVNCGDSNTNPCNRIGGVAVDVKGKFGGLSQPGRGVGAGPIGGKDAPKPIPKPEPQR